MKTIRRLDSSGDTVLEFDELDAVSRAKAAQMLSDALSAGGQAFKVNRGDGKPDEKVININSLENETIIIPRVVGG